MIQKQIYIEGAALENNSLCAAGCCCSFLKKHLWRGHLFSRNPPVLETCKHRKKIKSHFWVSVLFMFSIFFFVNLKKHQKLLLWNSCYKHLRAELKVHRSSTRFQKKVRFWSTCYLQLLAHIFQQHRLVFFSHSKTYTWEIYHGKKEMAYQQQYRKQYNRNTSSAD